MVVYLRRNGAHRQESVFLDYRTHLNAGVHRVQDYLLAHPETQASIADLAEIACMSERSLTRAFREATGLTIIEFRTKARIELAKTLLNNVNLSIDMVAEKAGFGNARHFRRAWNTLIGKPPSHLRV